MNADQTRLNNEYREVLNTVFGGEISLSDRYVNPNAVIKHHCNTCRKGFFAKPLWLVRKRQLHSCHATITDTVPKPKKTTAKKSTGTKKGNCTPNKVTEAMKLEMIRLHKEGNSLKSISRQFSVTPPTVKRHVQQKVS